MIENGAVFLEELYGLHTNDFSHKSPGEPGILALLNTANGACVVRTEKCVAMCSFREHLDQMGCSGLRNMIGSKSNFCVAVNKYVSAKLLGVQSFEDVLPSCDQASFHPRVSLFSAILVKQFTNNLCWVAHNQCVTSVPGYLTSSSVL